MKKFEGMKPGEIISTMSTNDSIKAVAFLEAFSAGNHDESESKLDAMSKTGLGIFCAFIEALIAQREGGDL